jgi:hypothetical protein
MFKLVEQRAGTGDLMKDGQILRQVRYRLDRYQGMTESGLPVPGLHRIEGSVELNSDNLDDGRLALRLETGQVVMVRFVRGAGRIFSEGHGPGVCLCC